MTIEEALLEIERLKQRVGDLETEINGADNDIERLEKELEERRVEPFDSQTMQLKHQKLFTGDLSRLSHADRRDLFEAIHDFDSIALARIENHI